DDESQLAWMKSTDVHIPITLTGRVQPLACTKDAVAVSTGLEYQRCTDSGCDGAFEIPNLAGKADVFDGGGVVFAGQTGRLIGVWRSGVAPVYVRAPKDLHFGAVVVWGGKPTLVFDTPEGLRPATL
ncbi:MAG TPA: hypothetical protein VL463_02175, partial [Kofleriaceae bacterium]|nr:hypothetical protein [Kofleriaceae bacterium]